MAARADGIGHDRLHHFIAAAAWDEQPLGEALCTEADRLVGGRDAVLVIDDTSLPKKGSHSVGWRRNARGGTVMSLCSGVVVQAEAGLLDGRRATTHRPSTGAIHHPLRSRRALRRRGRGSHRRW